MLPATASTMTAAICGPMLGKRRFESGAVVIVEDQGVPGEIGGDTTELGLPKVSIPEPAFTSRLSEWP
jgi:hypothetical protein